MVSASRNRSATAGSSSGKKVGERKGTRKERLTHPTSQGLPQGRQCHWLDETRISDTRQAPSWSSCPSFCTETAAETKTWGWADQLGAGGLLLASCSEPNTIENTAVVPGARGEELLQQVQREHVVYEEWSQRSAVLTGCGRGATPPAASWPGWRRSGSW